MIMCELEKLVQDAVKSLQNEDILSLTKDTLVLLEHPEDTAHGDYATNVALVLAKQLKKNPRDIAEQIAAKIDVKGSKFLDLVKAEGSGFVNFFLSREYLLK